MAEAVSAARAVPAAVAVVVAAPTVSAHMTCQKSCCSASTIFINVMIKNSVVVVLIMMIQSSYLATHARTRPRLLLISDPPMKTVESCK